MVPPLVLLLSNPIVFNVSAGQTFNENTPAITQTGTVANTITFQKSGAGANPVITPTGTTAATDFGIAIAGGDYITFNGIDINASAVNTVEYGYFIRNASATNGATNNTIQNMTISMTNTGTVAVYGIFQNATTTGGGFVPTAISGSNSGNRYYNFTISNTKGAAVFLQGNSSFPDANCEVGTTTCSINNTINGMNTLTATVSAGVRAFHQGSVKIFNNIIQNISTTANSSTLDGISVEHLASSTLSVGTCEVYNNKVLGVSNTATTAGIVGGIRVNLTNNATSISRVYNNWVTGVTSSNPTTGLPRAVGIIVQDAGTGTAATHNIDFNNVRIDNVAATNACLSTNTSTGTINVRNNVFANFTPSQPTNKHYIISVPNAVSVGAVGSVWNYNDYYLATANAAATTGPPNGFIALAQGNDYAALSQWQSAMSITNPGTDANTIQVNPGYIGATDLHVSAPALNNAASPNAATTFTWVTNDIDCQTRPQPAATNYDIGADEIEICTGTPTAGMITGSGTTCAGQTVVLNLTGASSGGGISYQWRSSTTSGGPYTDISGATGTTYTATNISGTTYYVVNVTCSGSATTVTTPQFMITANALPTAGVTPSSATLCSASGSVTLTASGGTSYSWESSAV